MPKLIAFAAILLTSALLAGAANNTYPAIAGSNCTIATVSANTTVITNGLNGLVWLAGTGASLVGLSNTCFQAAEANLLVCQADLSRAEGCCEAVCASGLSSVVNNASTAGCLANVNSAICGSLAGTITVPSGQLANLAAVFDLLNSLVKRCVTGTSASCPVSATNVTTNVTKPPPAATSLTSPPPPTASVTPNPSPAAVSSPSPPSPNSSGGTPMLASSALLGLVMLLAVVLC